VPGYQPEVAKAIESIADDQRRSDAEELLSLMSEVTGEQSAMWGKSFGFGQYHYEYKSGQQGDFFKIGFTPAARELTIYVMSGLRGFDDILARLGPHRASKSCVYVRRLEEVDRDALVDLISECVRHLDHVEKELGAIPRMSDIPPREEP
jgi:hypothetical protein